MGLLTDPNLRLKSNEQPKYVTFLCRFQNYICFVLYLAGIAAFCILGETNFNNGTYFSENALLPGLVYSEIKAESAQNAKNFLAELEHERETYKTGIPYPWLQAKMKQIGLETYTHNFTLNYPFGGGKEFQGKNVYGILRAPRIGSTESIVLSTPYRPPNTAHTQITYGVPLLLAFADFARKQKYWSKDIIFLVTDQEQLGMQAWLEAYHGDDDSSILNSGKLYGRAGTIIAGINFEIQDFYVDYINLKLEGLNGQLPNLDLHNLVAKLSHKQNIPAAYKMSTLSGRGFSVLDNLYRMLSMMTTQSSGIPNGNHGLFHRYGIEALTIEGVKRELPSGYNQQRILSQLKIIEGITRSLNNLLERFHQSFFFYVLLSSDRFISIGDYMPSIGLMAGCVLLKSFLLWLIASNNLSSDAKNVNDPQARKREISKRGVVDIGVVVIVSHLIGVLALLITSNRTMHEYFNSYGISTSAGIFYLMIGTFVASFLAPKFLKVHPSNSEFLNILVLLEMGTMLLSVSMFNFSLGFFLCIVIVPFVTLTNLAERNKPRNLFKFLIKCLLHVLLHPIVVVYFVVLLYSWITFAEMDFNYVLNKSFGAVVDAITYSVVDSLIYRNWLFDLVCLILLPCWTIFWVLNFSVKTSKEKIKLKEN